MGSIQSLKSWALAARANEDTDVQVSGYIGNVNKTFGRQVLDMIDKLQGVISQRTKAYNTLVNSINKAIEGKGGIGEKTAISALNAFRSLLGLFPLPGTLSGLALAAVSTASLFISNYFTGASLEHTANATVYDYERMASQLGYYKSSRTFPNDPTTAIDESQIVEISDMVSGASLYVDLRDSLMPRYRKNHLAGNTYNYANGIGEIGTLRRM